MVLHPRPLSASLVLWQCLSARFHDERALKHCQDAHTRISSSLTTWAVTQLRIPLAR